MSMNVKYDKVETHFTGNIGTMDTFSIVIDKIIMSILGFCSPFYGLNEAVVAARYFDYYMVNVNVHLLLIIQVKLF
jgi:hypothetical protein